MTYKEYAQGLGHTPQQIEEVVGGLFGADAEMNLMKETPTHREWDVGSGWRLFENFSAADVTISPLGEEYRLEY